MAGLVGVKDGEWIENRLGIRTRRFESQLDPKTAQPVKEVSEINMAQKAARMALSSANLRPEEINTAWYVSCTQPPNRQHFQLQAARLHKELELSSTCVPTELNAGCAGSWQAIEKMRWELTGRGGHGLLVTSSAPSLWMDAARYREAGAYLSMFIFGDGAAALVLSAEQIPNRGILASCQYTDPTHPLMNFHSPDGGQPVYEIEARRVAAAFRPMARTALKKLHSQFSFRKSEIKRWYFHQVNGKVLRQFALDECEIPAEKVAINVDHRGNTAAVATIDLVAEDFENGLLREGDLIIACTVGAGAISNATLIRI